MSSPVHLLHLSDLHRSPEQPFNNSSMLAALRSDWKRWSPQGDHSPDLILVSGDIVQGVPLGEPDFESKLEAQYFEASNFLEALADTFLDGNRERLVIVPGNHDVSWNTARSAMSPVDDREVAKLGSGIPWMAFEPSSSYRWDWSSQELRKVVDLGTYQDRCEAFLRFRTEFYAGCDADPLAIDRDLFFLSYPELDLSITGLSSWFGNDCFCHVGAVDPELLAAAQQATAASSESLHLAVWHHSIDGSPSENDYLDRSMIHQLIDYGFRVGFHGHQHRGDGFSLELRLPTSERFAIVSAGSFAAWGRDLPNGVSRQYNVVELDVAESTVLVKVRESIGPSVFVKSTRADLGGSGSVSLKFTPRPGQRSAAVKDTLVLDDAASLFGEGHLEQALEIIQRNDLASGGGRQLASEIMLRLEEFGELALHLRVPETADELVLLVRALCATREYDLAQDALNSFDESHQALGGLVEDLRTLIERGRAGL